MMMQWQIQLWLGAHVDMVGKKQNKDFIGLVVVAILHVPEGDS